MTDLVAFIGFFLVITAVILVHEAGHFFFARRFGMKVEEFFAGFGPRVWSTRRGETEYGLKWILLGGYVKIAGMNPYAEPPAEDLARTYGAKPIWQRAITIVSGPLSHFVMAFLALFLWLALVGQPVSYAAQIGGVENQLNGQVSPAKEAGLLPGDVVVSVNGEQVDEISFVETTRANANRELVLVVDRGGDQVTLYATPVMSEVEGEQVPRLGVLMTTGAVLQRDRPGVAAAFARAATMTWDGAREVLGSFGRIFGPEGIGRVFGQVFGETQRSTDDPMSLIGGAQVASDAARAAQWDLALALFVSLNIFLGLMNLLPLPPFDGGHLAALAIEKVRGKPIDMRKMVPIGAAVFGLLLVFAVALLYLDLAKPIPELIP